MAGAEITFSEHDFIVSKTDLNGKITYGNELFIPISGYGECELMGQPDNIRYVTDSQNIVSHKETIITNCEKMEHASVELFTLLDEIVHPSTDE